MSKEKLKYLQNNIKVSDKTIEWITDISTNVHRKLIVWLATEHDRNLDRTEKYKTQFTSDNIRYIQDWFLQKAPNISEFTFDEAYAESTKWHDELAKLWNNKHKNRITLTM